MLLSHPTQAPDATLVTDIRDYPEWHQGRLRYAVWIVPINCPALLSHIHTLQTQLSDLLHATRRQAHLTLFVCGFEQAHAVANDDFTPGQLRQQLEHLGQLRSPTCALQIGPADSFASAAFLPVHDQGGHLQRWRSALAQSCREVRQAAYVPHITLGLYKRQVSADELRQRLQQLPALADPQLTVEQLHYATYDSRDLFGRLETQRRIVLG
ncbi:2'-5' RNA ligase family protein [Pseudomonas sp.]|uniref:2'-5' RNA ligase family protein n=1 Tax=Pseudomonas sp. TaxID=306 RepID=UPI001A106DA2|nr:2'-5' RNA ligase family protein [Pseudomonas sp.]MBF0675866.1 2'-5' RNA ligase family protein [Pseudomonas sp.]